MYYQIEMTLRFKGSTEKEAVEAFESATDCANVHCRMQELAVTEQPGDFIYKPSVDRLAILRQGKDEKLLGYLEAEKLREA
jgi:hypothetical protein